MSSGSRWTRAPRRIRPSPRPAGLSETDRVCVFPAREIERCRLESIAYTWRLIGAHRIPINAPSEWTGWRASDPADDRRRCAERAAAGRAGRCTRCGKLPPRPDRQTSESCAAAVAERSRKHRDRRHGGPPTVKLTPDGARRRTARTFGDGAASASRPGCAPSAAATGPRRQAVRAVPAPGSGQHAGAPGAALNVRRSIVEPDAFHVARCCAGVSDSDRTAMSSDWAAVEAAAKRIGWKRNRAGLRGPCPVTAKSTALWNRPRPTTAC